MKLGSYEKVLYGKGTIMDVLCGCKFEISPKSFYQVNSLQTEVLYKTAIKFAQLNKDRCCTGCILWYRYNGSCSIKIC